ncbi:MAG: tetratricopeptide repeat protein [Actinomycetota bacterium]|nr:tetratricopeptide repeat protein [Actinomycetota bacterium]
MEDTELGVLLRHHRAATGLTQEELAERAGISTRTVSDVERGVRSAVYRHTASRLAEALGLIEDERSRFEAIALGRRWRQRLEAAQNPAEPALPLPPTRLIGREAELAAILTRLHDPHVRLLTLTGPGGIGKTRLALEAAAHSPYSVETCFVSLGETRDPRLVASLLAKALGIKPALTPVAAVTPVADLVRAHLGTRQWLLVLDTFEHLLSAAPLVADLLASCPGLTVLVTSRAALRVRGEHVFTLPPLGLSTDDTRTPSPAVALFVERTLEVCPDLDLDGPAATVAVEICERLEGLPLAIELAAVWTKHLPLAALRDHLDNRLRILTRGPRDLPPRQQTMRDTIGWSYDLLDRGAQVAFRRLSRFASWTLEAAETVCGAGEPELDMLAAMGALVDHSLAVLTDSLADPPRYAMLDVIREYAADQLDVAGETDTVSRRHAEYYCALAERAEPELRRFERLPWHRRLESELANLRLAFGWCTDRGEAQRALRLAGAIWMFWLGQGGFMEGRRWLHDALAMDAEVPAHTRAKALWGAGWLAYHQGDHQEAAALGEQLLELADRTGTPLDERNGLTLRGMTAMAQGRYREAAVPFERALAICRGLDGAWPLATSALNLGLAALHAGDVERAERLFSEAGMRYAELGDESYRARAMRQLGMCALRRGDIRQAEELFSTSLTISTTVGEDWSLAETLETLVLIDAVKGDTYVAAVLSGAAAALRERLGARQHLFDHVFSNDYLANCRTDQPAWSEGWKAGRTMPLADVVALARRH